MLPFLRYFNIRNIKQIHKQYFHRTTCLRGQGDNVRDSLFIPFQTEDPKRRRKVTICGAAGNTGTAMGYTLLMKNYCDEIVMLDIEKFKVKLSGEALDFVHGVSLRNSPKITICTEPEKTRDSDFIVFNSGVPRKPGQSRLEVAQVNINHFAEVVPCLASLSPDSVMLVVTNPSDLMTYACWKYSGFDKNRIIGTGTELDSSRFRYHIAKRLGINPISVSGWIIGEHGDSSVPVWSSVSVAGVKLRDIDPAIGTCRDKNGWSSLHTQTMKDGGTVVGMKGCTNYGIAQISDHIIRPVLSNSRTIHCVSTQMKGLYGIQTDCFLSIPCVLGNKGVSDIVQICLDPDETDKLNESACVLDEHMNSMVFP